MLFLLLLSHFNIFLPCFIQRQKVKIQYSDKTPMASLMAGSTLNTLAERELQGARLGPTGQATAQKANSCDRLRTVYSNSQAAKGKAVSKSAQNNWGEKHIL